MKEIDIEIIGSGEFTDYKISEWGNPTDEDFIRAALIMAYKAADARGCTSAQIIAELKTMDEGTEQKPDQLRDFANAIGGLAKDF